MTYDAIVIGAGPNGLTAAAILAKGGKKVLVVESADEIGGQTRPIEFAPGFRAVLNEDRGWLPPKVAAALGLKVVRPQNDAGGISMSVVAPDGRILSLSRDATAAAAAIRSYSARDAARWTAFVQRLHRFAEILGELYQLVPPDIDTRSVAEVLPLMGVGRRLRGLGRADMTEFLRVMPMSVQDLLDDAFESELLKAAVASCAIRDLRQGPRSGGTTFNLLHYMVGSAAGSVRGRAGWDGGPIDFCQAAADVGRKAGVTIRTSARVMRVVARDGAVTGVALSNGEEVAASVVISTADPKRTLLGLVDPVWLDPELMLAVKNVKLRGCTAYVLYAFDGTHDPASPLASMVGLTSSTTALERAADAAKYGEVSAEPHVEFFIPTVMPSSQAPKGKHVLVARVQYAPYALRDGAWDDGRKSSLERVATTAIGRAVPGFAQSIVHRVLLTPKDLEERFGVTEGALTHGEMTLDQIMFMRPVPGWGRYQMPLKGLFLGGAGAHPGPGVLGGAGYLAAKAALG